MQRKLGFQQQCYGDDGMWMDTQAQQQHNYTFHEESWNSDNNYHKQFPGMMHMKPGAFAMESDQFSKHHVKLGGSSHGMFQEIRPSGHGYGHHHHNMHGGGKNFPHGVANANHHLSNGGIKFNSGSHHDYFSEESEYEAYGVEHHGAAPARVDEMRYERHHNYGGGDHGFYANPYDRWRIQEINRGWALNEVRSQTRLAGICRLAGSGLDLDLDGLRLNWTDDGGRRKCSNFQYQRLRFERR